MVVFMMQSSLCRFFLIGLFFSLSDLTPAQDYSWPTDASRGLTSTFAESRPGRFHAGIDIKTWGREGYKVFAIRPGRISRIRVSPYGYGRALYLTLDTGEVVVYGHLKAFSDEIEQYVWQQQQKEGKYAVQLWPSADRFVVEQGDLIGYSGQTGIGYPHLHFEVRDRGNKPFNPLLLGYKVKDTIAPIIRRISVTPLDAYSHVENDWRPLVEETVYIRPGEYQIADTINVKGRLAFGVSAYDQMDGIHNKFGAYTISFIIDDREVFASRYDKFSYSINGMAKLDRDYRLASLGYGYFYKLFRDIGNELPFYNGDQVYHGAVSFGNDAEPAAPGDQDFNIQHLSGEHHTFEILVSDFWQNQSRVTGSLRLSDMNLNHNDSLSIAQALHKDLVFNLDAEFYDTFARLQFTASHDISGVPEVTGWYANGLSQNITLVRRDDRNFYGVWDLEKETIGPTPLELRYLDNSGQQVYQKEWLYFRAVPYGKKESLRTEDNLCKIVFYPNSLFRTMYIRSESVPIGKRDKYEHVGKIYSLQPLDVPMNRGAELYLTYSANDTLPQRLAIYRRNRNNGWNFVDNHLLRDYNQIRARIGSFGEFSLLRDTTPPEITYLYPGHGHYLQNNTPTFKAVFRDDLSGISGESNMVMWLDGEHLISEYDPEKRTLQYRVRKPLSSGPHRLLLLLRDRSGNETRLTHAFSVK